MLLTLAMVVLFSSIVVFFSDDFIKLFKNLFAIKGVSLFLPLFVASWLIYSFYLWFLWAVFYLRDDLHEALTFLTGIMPFQRGAESVALIVMLSVLSIVPVVILDIISRKKTYKGYRFPYTTSSIVLILCVFLLIII
ncbi:MAG: hypothetical protein ACRCXC_00490 [Legionella sp.]